MKPGHPEASGRRPGRPRRPTCRLAALLLAALGAAGCWGDPSRAGENSKGKAAALRAAAVTVAPVESRAVERTVDATGNLLAWEEAVLSTSTAGTITRLLVDLGDRVEAGQVLAEQDRREPALAVEQAEASVGAGADAVGRARAQVAAARAQLEQVRESRRALEAGLSRARAAVEETEVNLERMRKLVAAALVAQREVDVARTQYETARAQQEAAQVELDQFPARVRVAEAQHDSDRSAVRVAEAELRRREAELGLARARLADVTLRAPIAGAIARRHLHPGQHVPANTAVFTIVRSDPLKFTGIVAEHAALQLRPGQAVRVRVEPVPGRHFAGRVTRVSPAVDMASRTVQVEGEIPNPERLLKPGLFARAAVVLREDRGIAFVPESAVSYFAGITRVFVVADGTARERTVRLGSRRDGLVEVVEGVRPGEQVATSGLAQLQDGAPVAALPASQPRPRPAPRRRRARGRAAAGA